MKEMQLAIAELELAKICASLTVLSDKSSKELEVLLKEAIKAVKKAQDRVVVEQM